MSDEDAFLDADAGSDQRGRRDPDAAATDDGPLDPQDPRFVGVRGSRRPQERPRRLVASRGPGASPMDPRVRLLRAALPLVVAAGLLAVTAVFVVSLDPGVDQVEDLGDEAEVRAAVAGRPLRACLDGAGPCAWISEVDGELLALSTSGPLPDERGRAGVNWCASSGYYGADRTGSRYDRLGRPVAGPAPRSLDRFAVRLEQGRVRVDFGSRRAGRQTHLVDEVLPPEGEDCDEHNLDVLADLHLHVDG